MEMDMSVMIIIMQRGIELSYRPTTHHFTVPVFMSAIKRTDDVERVVKPLFTVKAEATLNREMS
jgi:hypothetical protein